MQPTTIRSSASTVNFVVGPMVVLIGITAAVAAVVLTFVMQTAWMLMLLLPGILGMGAGLFILWMARRARLEITGEGFTWCGFLGKPHSMQWAQLQQIMPPRTPGARAVALLVLRDGKQVDMEALWESQTSPGTLMGGRDRTSVRNQLIQGHQQWLAQQQR